MVHLIYVLDSVVLINTFFSSLAVLWHSAFQLLTAIPNPCFITTQKCLQYLQRDQNYSKQFFSGKHSRCRGFSSYEKAEVTLWLSHTSHSPTGDLHRLGLGVDKTSLDSSVTHPVIHLSHLRHRNVYYVNIENVYDRKIGNVCIHFLEKHFTLHTPQELDL